MSEGHLWFSIFTRPLSSQFTRVQRCTCCFVLLFTAMLFNILYYEQVEASKTDSDYVGFSFGPFYFTREEVCSILKITKAFDLFSQIGIGILVELISFFPSLLLVQFFRRIRPRKNSQDKVSPMHQSMITTKEKQRKFTFPWWCIFPAYLLSIFLFGTSILFIIIRSIELGDWQTQKWLTSVITGFFSSICLTQPLKVCVH